MNFLTLCCILVTVLALIKAAGSLVEAEMWRTKPKFPWQFLILAYGWTWLCWIPVALTRQDYQASPLLLSIIFLGVFGPGFAGIWLTYREGGKSGGRDFWQRVIDFRRIRPVWVALLLLFFPALHLISILLYRWLGGAPPEFAFLKEVTAVPLGVPAAVVLYLLQAALEELGWRGYLLDRLQARWKPLEASLILGVFHTFWHLPLFWMVGTNQSRYGFGVDGWLFLAFMVSCSIFSTWCYNNNDQSILAVILLHTVTNLCLDIFLLPGNGERIFKSLSALGAILVGISWVMPAWKITDKAQGYR